MKTPFKFLIIFWLNDEGLTIKGHIYYDYEKKVLPHTEAREALRKRLGITKASGEFPHVFKKLEVFTSIPGMKAADVLPHKYRKK